MVPLREFTRRTPSALGFGGGGSVASLEAGVDTDGEAVTLISDAEDVSLGIINSAVLELSELFKNENYCYI